VCAVRVSVIWPSSWVVVAEWVRRVVYVDMGHQRFW
jgi:hypothetical protein